MNIQFATCVRYAALEFIQKVYPSQKITDTEDCAKDLLDLVEKDIVRVQDPMMHGNRIAVIGGTNWEAKYTDAVVTACKKFDTSAKDQS